MTAPRAISIRGNLAHWDRVVVFDEDEKPIADVKGAVITIKAPERTEAILTFRDGSTQWCAVLPPKEEGHDLADFLSAVQSLRSQVQLASHATSPEIAQLILCEPATRAARVTIERLLPSVGAGS